MYQTSVISEQFLTAIKTVSAVIPAKPSMPVLGHVLLKAEQGALTLQATNLETAITARIGAKTELDFAVAIPPKAVDMADRALTRYDLAYTEKTRVLDMFKLVDSRPPAHHCHASTPRNVRRREAGGS